MSNANAIATGTYYNRTIVGLPVRVVGAIKPHRTLMGFYRVIVQADPQTAQQHGLPVEPFRLTLANRSDLIYNHGEYTEQSNPAAHVQAETSAQRAERIDNLFGSAEVLVAAAVNQQMKALVLTSGGGLGKSYMIKQALEESGMVLGQDYAEVKGNISAVGLYELLWNFRDRLVVIQDTDGVFTDETILSILKNALDTTGARVISWLTQNMHLAEKEIPSSFEFTGSCIFATNLDITKHQESTKIGRHMQAFSSRVHLMDLHLRNREDVLYLIRKICMTERYATEHEVMLTQVEQVIDWMTEHSPRIKSFNIRTVGQILNLVRISPPTWQNLAKATLLTNHR